VELLTSLLESDARDVTTTLSAPERLPPIICHYDALFRAFRNLVRNGIEAMESVPDPKLDITVALADDAAGRWLDVRIRDNGPGLPPGGGDRIFEPDFTTKTRGTGLGLALVRQAVTAGGGTVAARSHDGGAEFAVRLPAALLPPEQESP
jgi:signal transduction histidine kinase